MTIEDESPVEWKEAPDITPPLTLHGADVDLSAERNRISFQDNGNEVMSIGADGRFYVKGREIETDQEIRDTLVTFARTCIARNTVVLRHFIGESNGVYLGAYTFTAAVNEHEARAQIEYALKESGLSVDNLEVREITQDGPYAHIVWNGDY